MSWHPPVPVTVPDTNGTELTVRRAWPDLTAGHYILELAAPGRAGVRAAHLRAGQVELLPRGRDPRLHALAQVARKGEVMVHRAHMRAVVRAGDRYSKIFRAGRSADSMARHAGTVKLLDSGDFLAPEIVSFTPGCLTLTGLPGRSLFDLGIDPAVSDARFEAAWQRWSEGWVRQQSLARSAAHRRALEALPTRTAAVELENMQRLVHLWLLHAQNIPEAEAQRTALLLATAQIAAQLLGTAPDPLVWSHGDLHDKQIFAAGPDAPLGLLDFDEAARAEAAADLANLAVHLQLRLRQGRLTAARYQAALRHVLAAAEELRVTPARFEAYANATRLRLGCLYSFRPPWGALAEEFLKPPADGGEPLPAVGVFSARG
jgi:hypothetical protein